jgi:hypothetical protein
VIDEIRIRAEFCFFFLPFSENLMGDECMPTAAHWFDGSILPVALTVTRINLRVSLGRAQMTRDKVV